ncbi:hypothetical protein M9434_003810 [Picochlorum sp. BPE23]|nr:hypothetical protein M9434_003810 [Picochlorum sp. BPE23]|eukprot:jgi/Picre1/27612/NNA_000576.t1
MYLATTASSRAVGYRHLGGLKTPNTRRHFSTRIHSNDPKITREYREDDDTVIPASSSSPESPDTSGQGQSQYVDELPEVPRTEMSDAMKEKLRREYYGLGGSPNKAMGSNLFLNIILIVSFLAILSAALGYL